MAASVPRLAQHPCPLRPRRSCNAMTARVRSCRPDNSGSAAARAGNGEKHGFALSAIYSFDWNGRYAQSGHKTTRQPRISSLSKWVQVRQLALIACRGEAAPAKAFSTALLADGGTRDRKSMRRSLTFCSLVLGFPLSKSESALSGVGREPAPSLLGGAFKADPHAAFCSCAEIQASMLAAVQRFLPKPSSSGLGKRPAFISA